MYIAAPVFNDPANLGAQLNMSPQVLSNPNVLSSKIELAIAIAAVLSNWDSFEE